VHEEKLPHFNNPNRKITPGIAAKLEKLAEQDNDIMKVICLEIFSCILLNG
jgi:hypothetical protein